MSYKDLQVWQKAVEFVKTVYSITKKFPEDEKFGLVNQMRRAAVSIASNIAEGKARNTDKEFLNFLYIARGSAAEVETQIFIAKGLEFIDEKTYKEAATECEGVGKLINGMIKAVSRK